VHTAWGGDRGVGVVKKSKGKLLNSEIQKKEVSTGGKGQQGFLLRGGKKKEVGARKKEFTPRCRRLGRRDRFKWPTALKIKTVKIYLMEKGEGGSLQTSSEQ